MTSTRVPAALARIPLLDPEELVELASELEGHDEYVLEVVSAYAVIWPRRLLSLELAVAAEDGLAAQDAVSSIAVSSQRIGADRLTHAALEFRGLVEAGDFDSCRSALGVLATVGTETVEEIRERFLDTTASGKH